MKSRVLILCAPFGFGPAAKALIVAQALVESAEMTLCADRDAYRFIRQHKPSAAIAVLEGVTRHLKDRRSLSGFDFFINIGHAPALQYLHRHGLLGRTVFVDSLLPWRADNVQTPLPRGLLGYLAEDHPGAAARLDHRAASIVSVVAPLMAAPGADILPRERRGIVLHLGGVTSPLAPWETIAEAVARIAMHAGRLAVRYGKSVTMIGSPHLKSLALSTEDVSILGDISPEASVRLIAGAALVITTPGIGAVYEAMARDVPVFLLPPMNSTQLHHYQVFTSHGMHGVMPHALIARLGESAKAVAWERQTRLCLDMLRADTDALIAGLPVLFRALLENTGDAGARDQLLQGQRRIFKSFSRIDAIATLKTLLSTPPPDEPLVSRVVRVTHAASEPDVSGALSLERQLALLPKAELHVHLEGAISPALLLQLAERNKLKLPFTDPDQYHRKCVFGKFADFAHVFLLAVHCLKQPGDFFDAVADMGAAMARQNIRYAEVTWTPQFYLKRHFSLDTLLGAMNEARAAIKTRWGIEMRWIADLLRSHPAPALVVARWACSNRARAGGVVALGLGGPEAGYPAQRFITHFQEARAAGLPANPHAGEGAGAPSVLETIEHLNPSRIGHGVRSIEDAALVEYLARHALPLEVCLTSNIKLGVYASYAAHPVKRLVDAGCKVTLNTDDPVLFQTTLTGEYLHAIRDCGLDLTFVKQSIRDSVDASYLEADEKAAMLRQMTAGLETADSPPS